MTASRFGRSVDIAAAARAQPLSVFFFDVLHLDGVDLLDEPGSRGPRSWPTIVPDAQRVDRLVTDDPAAAEPSSTARSPPGTRASWPSRSTAPYEAGRRGAGWLKIKPVHTLDLVVLAVEWGSGRRTGKLSNIHLGARDPAIGGFVMLGKTFKGMTDAMLAWQTERFHRARRRSHRRVRRAAASRAGRRDRLRRRAALDPLSRRGGAAVRPRAALPRRQDGRARPTPSTPCARFYERPVTRQVDNFGRGTPVLRRLRRSLTRRVPSA